VTAVVTPPDNARRPGNRAYAWFTARRAARTEGWRRTDAQARAVICGLGLLVVGMVLHRLELVLIGMPLAIGLLLTTPPTGKPSVVAEPDACDDRDKTARDQRV